MSGLEAVGFSFFGVILAAGLGLAIARRKRRRTVEAEEFVVRDSTGMRRAKFGMSEDGGVHPRLFDKDGVSRVSLGATPNEYARLRLYDQHGALRAAVAVFPDDAGVGVVLNDQAGHPRMTFSVRQWGDRRQGTRWGQQHPLESAAACLHPADSSPPSRQPGEELLAAALRVLRQVPGGEESAGAGGDPLRGGPSDPGHAHDGVGGGVGGKGDAGAVRGLGRKIVRDIIYIHQTYIRRHDDYDPATHDHLLRRRRAPRPV
jgi:hypothetical protein